MQLMYLQSRREHNMMCSLAWQLKVKHFQNLREKWQIVELAI